MIVHYINNDHETGACLVISDVGTLQRCAYYMTRDDVENVVYVDLIAGNYQSVSEIADRFDNFPDAQERKPCTIGFLRAAFRIFEAFCARNCKGTELVCFPARGTYFKVYCHAIVSSKVFDLLGTYHDDKECFHINFQVREDIDLTQL